jgi:hypothetical protein
MINLLMTNFTIAQNHQGYKIDVYAVMNLGVVVMKADVLPSRYDYIRNVFGNFGGYRFQ